jgi:hypothetical protein
MPVEFFCDFGAVLLTTRGPGMAQWAVLHTDENMLLGSWHLTTASCRYGLSLMGKTVLWTDTCARTTTDAVHGILQTHHHGGVIGKAVIVIVIVVVIVLIIVNGCRKSFDFLPLDQIEHITRTDLEATATTDATGLIDLYDEGWGVFFTTTG